MLLPVAGGGAAFFALGADAFFGLGAAFLTGAGFAAFTGFAAGFFLATAGLPVFFFAFFATTGFAFFSFFLARFKSLLALRKACLVALVRVFASLTFFFKTDNFGFFLVDLRDATRFIFCS